MKLFSAGDTRVSFNPLLLLPLLYYVLNDGIADVMLLFLSLSLHEACHTLMARILGYDIESIEIHPFGFEARLSGMLKSVWDELSIAAAGPLFSIITGVCCKAFDNDGSPFLSNFANMNIALGFLNLAPAYPLDGGRILLSALSLKADAAKAKRACVIIGFLLSVMLVTAGLIITPFNPSLIIFGIFMLLAGIGELKRLKTVRLSAILRSRNAVRHGDALPVRYIALHRSTTYREAMRYITSNAYTIIIILDDDMNELGRLSQSKLMDKAAAMKGGAAEKSIF